MWMKISVDPGQLASDEANWSGSALFSKEGKEFQKVMHTVCLFGQIRYLQFGAGVFADHSIYIAIHYWCLAMTNENKSA